MKNVNFTLRLDIADIVFLIGIGMIVYGVWRHL